MSQTLTAIPIDLIERDERGIAYVRGTGMKVSHLVLDVRQGMTPQEIVTEYPHVTLAQIHAALSYYYAHQKTVDAQIREDQKYAEAMRQKQGNPFDRETLLTRSQFDK